MAFRLPLLLLALAIFPASAQTVYKSTRPDGSVVYSDAPVPGAKVIGRFQLVPLPPEDEARARQSREQEERRSREADEWARQREQALGRADEEVKAALDNLKTAQQRLQEGVEPLPGERTGSANRRSRLNEAYYRRMAELEAQVSAAVKRLDAAYAARNQLR